MFKGIVTMKNGTHKVIRVAVHMVAKIVCAFRECRRCIFQETWFIVLAGNDVLDISEIKSIRFINERTCKELLTLA